MALREAPAGVAAGAGSGWFPAFAFLAFLALVFVGLEPFQHGDAVRDGAGQGNIARQISYFIAFAAIAACALNRRGLRAFSAVPLALTLLLAWCVASALWSIDPLVTFRRAALALIVVLATLFGVSALGPDRSLRLWRIFLVLILVANWISLPLFEQAVHQPGDSSADLVGAWRGVLAHKNIAGAISAMSALVFLHFALETRRPVDWFLCLGSLAFLAMTESKTSLGLLPIALVAYCAYRFASRRALDRQIVMVGAALVFLIGASALLLEAERVAAILSDPSELTGRTAIWQAQIAYIGDHPLLGAGFGAFADTGTRSPIFPYVSAPWIAETAHGHNGYLQLLVTIGIPGFALAIVALVVQPVAGFLRGGLGAEFRPLVFAIFSFVVLHNLVESDFLEGDGPIWVSFLIVLGLLRESRVQAQS
ncbi:MAG: O-antigen ligase family protein [Alphaproteobacteria bacterium]